MEHRNNHCLNGCTLVPRDYPRLDFGVPLDVGIGVGLSWLAAHYRAGATV